jgi:hypothetical protein
MSGPGFQWTATLPAAAPAAAGKRGGIADRIALHLTAAQIRDLKAMAQGDQCEGMAKHSAASLVARRFIDRAPDGSGYVLRGAGRLAVDLAVALGL